MEELDLQYVERQVQVAYRHLNNDRSFHGHLTGKFEHYNSDFFIYEEGYQLDPNFDSHKFQWEFHHLHQLRCFYVDDEKKWVLYEKFDTKLSDFLLSLKRDKEQFPIMEDQTIPHLKIPIDLFEEAPYVADPYKKILRSILKYVHNLHQNNFYLNKIDMSNLAMKDEELKVFGVTAQYVRDAAERVNRRQADFQSVHDLFEEIFEGRLDELPYDMKRLMNILLYRFPVSERHHVLEMLPDHIAVLSHAQRTHFMENVDQKRVAARTKKYVNSVMRKIGSNLGWKSRVKPWYGLLEEVLEWPNTTYCDSENFHENCNLFRFIRNAVVHIKNFQKKYNLIADDVFIDAIMMHVFSHQICRVQEKMSSVVIDKDTGKTLLSIMVLG
ncbi:hypothetical protein M5689_018892 [Euphorbia peplus]|nr:hypothetical protein M5689_018892 [Euphorbia peplus]